MRRTSLVLTACCALLGASCGGTTTTTTTPHALSGLSRARFNQLAVRLNVPLYWASDDDGTVDPSEVRALLFYGDEQGLARWVEGDRFTDAFRAQYAAFVAADAAERPTEPRRALLFEELESVAPTLLETDLTTMAPAERQFTLRMLDVARAIDRLYARQRGMGRLADQVDPNDPMAESLFRRNWGPRCRGATTESNPACSAIAGEPEPLVDAYPEAIQTQGFCARLEAREDAPTLLTPFTVVTGEGDALHAVPITERYADDMRAVSELLNQAAADLEGVASEGPLRAYLRAAATSFTTNDWVPADEAWAAMNVRNSGWYVRVAPDEVYWDPCSQHAGFHLTFARIDRGSLEWQDRLTPLQTRMEEQLATLSDGTYEARSVSFHLPDFIEIVLNAGDDRDAFGATIGQSLPNWGPVADEGRGRTVAMTNLYTDPDSLLRRRANAASVLSAATFERYTDDQTPSLLSTILHEATHNLGPAHDYRVDGHIDNDLFGGELASMLEELKAQSGALYYPLLLEQEGILTREQVEAVWLDSVVWAFGHISSGMYTVDGHRKPYSQLAAVQVGFLMDEGALTWDPGAPAANGQDTGAFTLDFERMRTSVVGLMRRVLRIKARGDRQDAEALAARYVDGQTVPHAAISERYHRQPRTSFVYSFRR